MIPSKIRTLLPYAIVVFLGYVGFSLPLPVLPEIFIGSKRSILPASFSIEMKTILLGFVLAAYPTGQLLGSPLLGLLSDRYGRKKVILCSLACTALGYTITALATAASSVVGFFGGLFFCGLSEGNVTIAQAVIGDISQKDEKVAHFGWVNLFSCTAFIIGPLLGGWLSDPQNHPLFTFAIPFWLGVVLSLAAMIVIGFFSSESRKQTQTGRNFIQDMKDQFELPLLRRFYLANFLLYFGLYSFWNCIGIFLQRRFDFSSTGIAYVMAYNALFFAFGLLFIVHPLAKKLKPYLITGYSALILAGLLVILVLPKVTQALYFTVPPLGILISILMTNAAVMVSDAAPPERQGQALGTLQSLQVLSGMCVGILGGLLAAVKPQLPLLTGALMVSFCAITLLRKRYG